MMKVKITRPNGWYKDCGGLIFDVEEKLHEKWGSMLVLKEDAADFGTKISRFIDRANCEIVTDEAPQLETLQNELRLTREALTVARKLMNLSTYIASDGYDGIICGHCHALLSHEPDCIWFLAEETYTTALARLDAATK